MKCIFCEIVKNKKIDRKFEDDNILVFSPLNPINKGHLLIIPKEHFENIYDIPEELLSKIVVRVKIITKSIKSDGVNVLHASGKSAQQSVPHFHIHLVPRYKNDGLDLWLNEK
jgi:histidine triad (HIT) family protein